MAHFAKLDSNNTVLRVSAVDNKNILDENGIESEQVGQKYLKSVHGESTWVQTSYYGKIRKNFAGIGFKYDAVRNAFIPPQPYPSWKLDEATCQWIPPVGTVKDGLTNTWNENKKRWNPR